MDKFIIIDGNSLINRAFFALPPTLKNKDGKHTNAVYGFTNMLIKAIQDEQPKYIAVAFDVKHPTFRHKKYDGYKATRKGMPDELAEQMPMLKDLLKCMGITYFEQAGYEADDIIGVLAKHFKGNTIIITGDKDALQLVDDNVEVWLTKRGISEIQKNNLNNFKENTGLNFPKLIIDYKALMGDASDNIPGVSGIGEKTALNLIEKYGSLNGVYENLESEKGRLKEKLENEKDKAYLSYELAKIDTDFDISASAEDCTYEFPFSEKVYEQFIDLQFKTILDKSNLFVKTNKLADTPEKDIVNNVEIKTNDELDGLIFTIMNEKRFSFHLAEDISIATDNKTEYTIKIRRTFLDDGLDFDTTLLKFKTLFKNQDILKIVFDLKSTLKKLDSDDINNVQDSAMLMYLLDSNFSILTLNNYIKSREYDNVNYATFIFNLYYENIDSIKQRKMEELYALEQNVSITLFSMEKIGFKIDINLLNELSDYYNNKISRLRNKVYELTGEKFNLNSPKQLAEVLYDKLGLMPKNKKSRSTDVESLKSIEDKHKAISYIMEYRAITKLNGTYIEGFKPLLDGYNKIHTVFQQMTTATGRLSSTEPNLQNIPIKTTEGAKLRKMFVPQNPDHILIGADYSQIELRLMAHFSNDEKMTEDLINGVDIHSSSAALIFDVDINQVTADMRRTAKAINFGLIYGKGEYSLAEELGIPVYKAKDYIEKFFDSHKKVKQFMNDCITLARENGYATTILNRQRYIPEIKSSNFNLRSASERIAMNTPLQGSAADIIKLAMVNVDARLKRENLKSRLILQVHDELVIDALRLEIDCVKNILKQEMENAVKLKVPLTASIYSGENWLEIE